MTLQWQDFESPDYQVVYEKQSQLIEQRLTDAIPDTVMMGEHAPVITLGRGTDAGNVFNPTIPVVSIERGGDVTYHGPGQLVVYPILKLDGDRPNRAKDLHQYLRTLEDGVIDSLREFDIKGVRYAPRDSSGTEKKKSYTGVWVTDSFGEIRKIASVGVAVKRWVTYHGLALNVSTDLSAYHAMNPCGFSASVMTSMEHVLKQSVSMNDVKRAVKKAINHRLNPLE